MIFLLMITDDSYITIHNPGTVNANYMFGFFDSAGTRFDSNIFVIPPGGYQTYTPHQYLPPGNLYSVVTQSDQIIAPFVSTNWTGTSPYTSTGYNGVYYGTTTAFVPFISKNNLDTSTQVIVQNLGTASSDVTIKYVDGAGTEIGSETAATLPGASHIFDQSATAFLPDGFRGSAIITSTFGQQIAAVGFISRKIGGTVIPNFVPNGGFESGSNGVWGVTSTNGYSIITPAAQLPCAPHSGNYSIWLGRGNNETGRVFQQIYYWVNSTEGGNCCGGSCDSAYVRINSNIIKTYPLCSTNNTGGWVLGQVDVSGYRGQTVNLIFEVINNGSNISSFFLDDVVINTPSAPTGPSKIYFPSINSLR